MGEKFFRNNLSVLVLVSLVFVSFFCFLSPAYAVDTDGDGLSDEVIVEVGRIKIVHGDGTTSYYSFTGNYSINSYADTDGQPGDEIILTEVDRVRIINDREGTSSYHSFSEDYFINSVTDTDGQPGKEIIVVTPGTAPYTLIYIISDASKNRYYQMSGNFTIVGVQDYDAVSGAEICYSWERDQTFYHSIIIDRTQDYVHYTDGCSWPSEETLDTTEPVTYAYPGGGTYWSPKTVSLTCEDLAGSGCAATYYCIAPSATGSCQPDIEYTAPLSITASSKIMFYSEDNAGNREDVLSEVYSFAYLITATSGAGGGISPGTIWVEAGSGQSYTFTITPETGYVIDAVYVDGSYVGMPDTHTFENVASNHTIHADFAELTGDPLPRLPALFATDNHSLALKADGTVWGWGSNYDCQMGSISGFSPPAPVLVPAMSGTVAVAAGPYYSAFIRSDGTVWAMGYNLGGVVGQSNYYDFFCEPMLVPVLTDVIAIDSDGNRITALKSDGTVWWWGQAIGHIPVPVGNLTDVVAITANLFHSLALKSDGTVWAWGDNARCELGNGGGPDSYYSAVRVANLTEVVAIDAGRGHSLALKSDGTVWAWGYNGSGELGNPFGTESCFPQRVGNYDTGEFITDAVAVSAGSGSSYAVLFDGTVLAWGHNGSGQLGDGSTINSPTPVEVAGISNVVAVSSGYDHSLALLADGTVWSWGSDEHGELGNGDALTGNVLTPEQIPLSLFVDAYTINATASGGGSIRPFGNKLVLKGADQYFKIEPDPGFEFVDVVVDGASIGQASRYMFMDVTSDHEISATFRLSLASMPPVSAGANHSLVLKPDGTVWASGDNNYGQLGDGSTVDRWSPVQINLTGVHGISARGLNSAALKTNGTVWTWGYNGLGQLGDGTTTNRPAPVQAKVSSGTDLTDVVSISAGYHMAALRSDGTVWTWGKNNYGQLGDGTTQNRSFAGQVEGLSSVVAIATGSLHTLALKSDGTVWAWGLNIEGELGDDQQSGNWSATPVQVSGLSGVEAIYAGNFHNLALKTNGELWAWGYNYYGQLGDDTTINRLTPVQVKDSSGSGYLTGVAEISAGQYYTVALNFDGTVWAWGDNTYGQLADDTIYYSTLPRQIPGLTGVTSIAAGDHHALALSANTVFAWGHNGSGQFGTGTAPHSAFALMTPVTAVDSVTAGWSHTIGLKSDGTVIAWGQNVYGQLGDGQKYSYSYTPVAVTGIADAVAVSSGALYSIAIEGTGYAVKTWGSNYTGQLGDGTTSDKPSPVSPGVTNAVSVDGGFYHTVAVKLDGKVWAWGDNYYGQLGYTPGSITPVEVPGIGNMNKAAAGANHVVALDGNGDVWTWGRNNCGQLGDGTTANRSTPYELTTISNVVAIAAGNNHTVALDANGDVWAWGCNDFGQLGTTGNRTSPYLLTTINNVVAIAAGGYHTLALKSDGTVWAWGYNGYGQLGNDTTTNSVIPVQVQDSAGYYLTDVFAVSAGGYHSLALMSGGTVWAWGDNSSGQLGVPNYPLAPEGTLF